MKTIRIFWLAGFSMFICVHFCISQQNRLSDTLLIKDYISKAREYFEINKDSSYPYLNKALLLSQSLNLPGYISIAKENLGVYYVATENFGKATQLYLEALRIEEKRINEKRMASIYGNLGYIYRQMENFNKSLNYYLSALAINNKFKDTMNIAINLAQIGSLHSAREYCEARSINQRRIDYTEAINYIKRAIELHEKINNEEGIVQCYLNLSSVYNKFEMSAKALPLLLRSIEYFKKNNKGERYTDALYILGSTYYKLGRYKESIESYQASLNEARKRNLTDGIQYLYELMAQTYDSLHDYKNARDYYIKYMILRDSIYNNIKSKQVFELETKFQVEKKEKAILTLQLQKKKKNLFIYSIVSVFVVLCTLGIYIINHVRNKRIIAEQINKINEQKIKELQKDQQLLATQMVLQGEEAERGRLARDLHDGLGGLLSGVKLTLSGLKGNYVITDKNVDKYDHALNLLDSSIKEMRRISHNMMPEALVKFGLKEALEDFCHNLTNKNTKINFQFFGIEKRIDSNKEISLYRIAQELVNNVLKHSQASELIVQLIQEENRVNLTIQDDGKGFDTKILNKSKGSGFASIRSRVESFSGRFDLFSEPGNGTEITIEFDC